MASSSTNVRRTSVRSLLGEKEDTVKQKEGRERVSAYPVTGLSLPRES